MFLHGFGGNEPSRGYTVCVFFFGGGGGGGAYSKIAFTVIKDKVLHTRSPKIETG